jgi:predicted PurR-regulated permease PerM
MNNVTHIVQKVRQAPWRVQRQWIGLFLLGLVVIAMVAGVYLNITVRATLAGREIQQLRNPSLVNPWPDQPNSIATNQRINTELETQLAGLTSVETMQARTSRLLLSFSQNIPNPGLIIS